MDPEEAKEKELSKGLRWTLKPLKWLLEHIAPPIITAIIILKLIAPPVVPNITTSIVCNTGSLKEFAPVPFRFEWKQNKTPWLKLLIKNDGDNCAENLESKITLLKDNKIVIVEKTYEPEVIESRIDTSVTKEESFYEKLHEFPGKSSICYHFHLAEFVKSSDEIRWVVCSRRKNWSTPSEITLGHFETSNDLFPNVYAAESPDLEKKSPVPASGILIGGYDPVVMSNELFLLLQGNRLITKEDASEIKRIIENYDEGVLFGGINLLKLNELILRKLISNKIMTAEQANAAIEKSKNAGGVLIGKYNVIILEVEILNTLLKNRRITLQEGQRVIDQAKAPSTIK
jgi:hypothetical protein